MATMRKPLTDPGKLEENKALVEQIIERVFVHGEDAAIDELVAEDFTPRTFGSMPPGREGLREGMNRAGAGVSDPEFEIQDMIAEGDRVAARITSSATHSGMFMGLPASGNRYTIEEIHIFRIRDGQLLEHWHAFDTAGLLAQLESEVGDGDARGRKPGGPGPTGAAPR
jgi:steroid delta-isomerase-like uncharacterized protein